LKKRSSKILRITQLGEPVLRARSKRVAKPTAAETQLLIADMLVTMKKAQGVGIAAPQVNVGLQLFIVAPEPSSRYPNAPQIPPVPMINPKLVRHSRATISDWEGCLSIPGIRGKVPRYQWVDVQFTATDGKRLQARLTDFVARIFQHEFDHICGQVFLDRVADTRTLMVESEYRKLWAPKS
jgi:peptide deformylase